MFQYKLTDYLSWRKKYTVKNTQFCKITPHRGGGGGAARQWTFILRENKRVSFFKAGVFFNC